MTWKRLPRTNEDMKENKKERMVPITLWSLSIQLAVQKPTCDTKLITKRLGGEQTLNLTTVVNIITIAKNLVMI